MPTGRVKWFSLEKGFGFIANDEGEDVYLAATSLPEGVATIKPGTKLEFSIADSRKCRCQNYLDLRCWSRLRPNWYSLHNSPQSPRQNLSSFGCLRS